MCLCVRCVHHLIALPDCNLCIAFVPQVLEVFPSLEPEFVEHCLHRCEGDPEAVILQLLEGKLPSYEELVAQAEAEAESETTAAKVTEKKSASTSALGVEEARDDLMLMSRINSLIRMRRYCIPGLALCGLLEWLP